MPTTITKTVKSSAGDYTSLSAWEAGEQGDLVSADEIRQAECYAFQDTTAVVINGSTTDTTRYLRIFAASGAEAQMPYSTSAYRLEVNGSACLDIQDEHIRVEAIQAQLTASGSLRPAIIVSSGANCEVFLDRLVVKGVLSGVNAHKGINFNVSGSDKLVVARNCVVYDFTNGTTDSCAYENGSSSSNVYMYNCLSHNSYRGFLGRAATRVRNCIAIGSNDGFVTTAAFHGDSNYNVSDIASDAPGANSQNGVTPTFVDEANDNFHLDSGDTIAKDTGEDLSGVTHGFSVDIDGATRSGSWDIGPDEVASSGAAQLEAIVSVSGGAIADLSTAIEMQAAISAHGDASASLSVDINFDAQATAAGSLTADLTTEIRMEAAVSATSTLSADLTVEAAPLQAVIGGSGVVSAALTTEIQMSAGILASGGISADLTTSIEFSAGVSTHGDMIADLTTSIDLAASIVASAQSIAQLQTAIEFEAIMSANGFLTADLSTGVAPDVIRFAGVRISIPQLKNLLLSFPTLKDADLIT